MTAMEIRDFILRHTTLQSPAAVSEIRLHLGADIFALWEAIQKVSGTTPCAPPFWAFPWVGGQALARYVLDHPVVVRDKYVLDIASGSGICAIAASIGGASHVLAIDIDPWSIGAISLSAVANEVRVEPRCFDPLDDAPPKVDLILVGDACYEAGLAARIVPWLRTTHDSGTRVLVGDPRRAHLPTEQLELLATYDISTSRDLEDAAMKPTGIFTLTNAESPEVCPRGSTT